VTEAGFGADLGAEKFFNIKCRKAGLKPEAVVIVATVRALKMHGGVAKQDLGAENAEAVGKGCENLARHIENVKSFGVQTVVAINQFITDSEAELEAVRAATEDMGAKAVLCSHWSDGGAGCEDLARHVVELVDNGQSNFAPIYPDDMPLWDKIRTVATKLYGARDISADKKVRQQLDDLQQGGYGHFPICMAKTQYSFSTDPNSKGAPSGHIVPVREVRISAGAEFIVAITGEIMTMPGLPRVPAANSIGLNDKGQIEGLF